MAASKPRTKTYVVSALILVILISIAAAYISSRAGAAKLPASTVISESVLEEKYGVRVNLVALTANGGMIDLRLKIVDNLKASLLLADKNNFPALFVNDSGVTLNASEEDKAQGIRLEDGGNVFLLFSNAGNAVKSGATVDILFGDTAVGEIAVK